MEKLVYGGDGLARLDGRVVFTPFVLPGERIRADAEQEKPGLVRAHTLEVLEPAPERVAAPCPYFGRCGGCHYQHAPYAYQLAMKRAILVEEFRRLGKIEPPRRYRSGLRRAVGLPQSRATPHRGQPPRIPRGALAQAVPDRSLPDQLAQNQ